MYRLIVILLVLVCCQKQVKSVIEEQPIEPVVVDTTPVLSPYYGQCWECVTSQDFYISIDTIKVSHVWNNRVVPFNGGPDIPCVKLRRVTCK